MSYFNLFFDCLGGRGAPLFIYFDFFFLIFFFIVEWLRRGVRV